MCVCAVRSRRHIANKTTLYMHVTNVLPTTGCNGELCAASDGMAELWCRHINTHQLRCRSAPSAGASGWLVGRPASGKHSTPGRCTRTTDRSSDIGANNRPPRPAAFDAKVNARTCRMRIFISKLFGCAGLTMAIGAILRRPYCDRKTAIFACVRACGAQAHVRVWQCNVTVHKTVCRTCIHIPAQYQSPRSLPKPSRIKPIFVGRARKRSHSIRHH